MKIEKFEEFKSAVKTLTERYWASWGTVKEETPGCSEKAWAAAKVMENEDFGCGKLAVKKLVEAILGDPIPYDPDEEKKKGKHLPVGVLFVLKNNPNMHDYANDAQEISQLLIFENGDLLSLTEPTLKSRDPHGVRMNGREGNSLPRVSKSYRRATEKEETVFWKIFGVVNEKEAIDPDLPVDAILKAAAI